MLFNRGLRRVVKNYRLSTSSFTLIGDIMSSLTMDGDGGVDSCGVDVYSFLAFKLYRGI